MTVLNGSDREVLQFLDLTRSILRLPRLGFRGNWLQLWVILDRVTMGNSCDSKPELQNLENCMKILGIDICFGRGVCWLLEEAPKDLKAYWKKESKQRSKKPHEDPLTFNFNNGGIAELLKLKPDATALEPTGMHYSWFVSHVAAKERIEVLWVGHEQAVYYRRQNRLPDKNDLADALALAAYACLYYGRSEYFLDFNPYPLTRLRELYLQIKSLEHFQTAITNRLRQQLAREFPEAASAAQHPGKDGRCPLWVYLSGRSRKLDRRSYYWEKRHNNSVATKYGVTISWFTCLLAGYADDLDVAIFKITIEIKELLAKPEFAPYILVFDEFNFGVMLKALLISQIYPFERFESIGAFKRRIGAAKDEFSSGKIESWKTGSGSGMCRSEMYLWCVVVISRTVRRPTSQIGQKIADYYDGWIAQFKDNPDLWKQEMRKRVSNSAVEAMEASVKKIFLPMLDREESKEFEVKLAAIKSLFVAEFAKVESAESTSPPTKETRRKFGKLVIGKTTGYTARWLYRRLKVVLSSL